MRSFKELGGVRHKVFLVRRGGKRQNIRESHPLLMAMASVSAKPSAGGMLLCLCLDCGSATVSRWKSVRGLLQIK